MPNQALIDKLLKPYILPTFITEQQQKGGSAMLCDGVVPTDRLHLAHLPTPVEDFSLPECPEDVKLSLKRDDMTGGIELTGNKVRKLEFIMAEALTGVGPAIDAEGKKKRPATRIYTAGGTQSNHARATVAACAKLGLPVEVFLRKDPSNYNGNIFLDQLFGATVHEFKLSQWQTIAASSPTWLHQRAADASAAKAGENVFVIPVGGSTPMGAWGYIEFVNELSRQVPLDEYGSVVCTSGSGGTLAGLGLGMHFYNSYQNTTQQKKTAIVSYSICDTPEWFEDKVGALTTAICSAAPSPKALVDVRDARGEGYSLNTVEELQFISRVAREQGVAFDTCYTGKALFNFWKDVKKGAFSGQKALYIHTGGGTSIFDKKDRLLQSDPLL